MLLELTVLWYHNLRLISTHTTVYEHTIRQELRHRWATPSPFPAKWLPLKSSNIFFCNQTWLQFEVSGSNCFTTCYPLRDDSMLDLETCLRKLCISFCQKDAHGGPHPSNSNPSPPGCGRHVGHCARCFWIGCQYQDLWPCGWPGSTTAASGCPQPRSKTSQGNSNSEAAPSENALIYSKRKP